MAKKSFRYQHIYSVVDGKAPSATTLLEGEIAVNAFADNEKLFIKNSSGDVVDFPRSYSIKDIDEDMEIIAAALNELNDRKADWVSAVTSGAVIQTESASTMEFYNRSGDTLFTMPFPEGGDVDMDFDSGSTKALANSAITVTLEEMQKVTSAALNDLNMRKLDISAHTLFDEQLFVANGEFVESSTTAVFKNLSGDTLFEIPAGGGGGRPINEGDDIRVISGETADTIYVSADTVIDSASTRVVQSKAIAEALDTKLDKVNFLNKIYPKGSIYITESNTNPSTFIGGTWELIGGEDADKNYYPAFAINTDAAGTTIDESLPNIKATLSSEEAINPDGGMLIANGKYTDGAARALNIRTSARYGQTSYPITAGEVELGSGQWAAGYNFDANRSSSTYQDGAQVNVNAIKLFFWKRTDDAPIAMMLETVTLEKVKDVLWTGNTASGTITLSSSMNNYDAIEFTYNMFVDSTTYNQTFEAMPDKIANNYIVPITWNGTNRRMIITNVSADKSSFTVDVGEQTTLTQVRGIKDAYVSRTDITTEINSGSTDDKAASAKAVYDYHNVKKLNPSITWNFPNLQTDNGTEFWEETIGTHHRIYGAVRFKWSGGSQSSQQTLLVGTLSGITLPKKIEGGTGFIFQNDTAFRGGMSTINTSGQVFSYTVENWTSFSTWSMVLELSWDWDE